MVAGSITSQRSTRVASSVNGSRKAVPSSGRSTMSDSLMPFQPVMEDPSNIWPFSKNSSSTFRAGMVTCCSLPRVSVKRRSTHLISCSSMRARVLADMYVLRLRYGSIRLKDSTDAESEPVKAVFVPTCTLLGQVDINALFTKGIKNNRHLPLIHLWLPLGILSHQYGALFQPAHHSSASSYLDRDSRLAGT